MKTLVQLAVTFKALGGMDAVDGVALTVYTSLVDAVEAYEDHSAACEAVQAIINDFDY